MKPTLAELRAWEKKTKRDYLAGRLDAEQIRMLKEANFPLPEYTPEYGTVVKVNGKRYVWQGGFWWGPSGMSIGHPNTLAKIEAAALRNR